MVNQDVVYQLRWPLAVLTALAYKDFRHSHITPLRTSCSYLESAQITDSIKKRGGSSKEITGKEDGREARTKSEQYE